MGARNKPLIACSLVASALLAGCSAILGDWSLGETGDDGGPSDATTDQEGSLDGHASEAGPDVAPVDGGVDAPADVAGEGSTCTPGEDCSEAGSCQRASISCAGGSPRCEVAGPAQNGTPCGNDLYCEDGGCAPCADGGSCVPPANPCHEGSATCSDGGIACADLGTSLGDGTYCGPGSVCVGGTCGAGCYIGGSFYSPGTLQAGNACQSCQPNVSTSTWSPVSDGIACGNGTCSGGACLVTITFDMAVYGGATASVSTNPASAISCTGPCSQSAPLVVGTPVTLTVTASGNNLIGWTGACMGSGASCTFTPAANAPLHLVVSHDNFAFVTSATTSNGNLGGLSGADAFCQTAATNAGLPPDGYQALLVTSGMTNMTSRLAAAGARGWVRVDGQPFADQTSDLTSGAVRTPLEISEKGTPVNGGAWTGANPDGTPSGMDCSAFTSSASTGNGTIGLDYQLGGSWNAGGTESCDKAGIQLYCFGTSLSNPLLYPKTPGRIAFLSKASFDTSKGLSGGSPPSTGGSADVLCQTEANAAGLSGTFLALLATTGVSAASRFDSTGPTWVRPDGIALASTAAIFMQGTLVTALNEHADGSFAPLTSSGGYVRTGAWAYPDPGAPMSGLEVPASSPADTCNDWTSGVSTDTGSVGLRDAVSSDFFGYRGGTIGAGSFMPVGCGATLPVYCLQK